MPDPVVYLPPVNFELLQKKFNDDPRLFQLADKLTLSQPQHIVLKNLAGSSPEFLVTAIFKHPVSASLNHVIVLSDAEEAAYFFNSIESVTEAMDLFYFPSSFKTPHNFNLLNQIFSSSISTSSSNKILTDGV